MVELDAATFLLQWATGCLALLWVTTRRREVSLGYGWMIRATAALLAAGSLVAGLGWLELVAVRELASAGVVLASTVALGSSVVRRGAGVEGQRSRVESRTARVAAMTGIERGRRRFTDGPEFDARLDLVAPVIGMVGVAGTALSLGEPEWLAVGRLVVGTLFLGAVTDAMLLGHWYLVQPGLARGPLLELVRVTGWLTVPELALLLVPTGMGSVLTGAVDDGWGGMLGWFWLACAATTAGLVVVTRLALKERQYAAVMAATGLLYLAILTAFGVDLIARALLA